MAKPELQTATPRLVGWLVATGTFLILGIWLLGSLRVSTVPVQDGVVVTPVQPTLERAREVVRRYFESPDAAGRIDCLHDSVRVAPLWRDFHLERGKPVPMLDSISTGEMAVHEGRTLAFFTVELSPGGRQPLALYWEGDRFGIDWESHVAYGTMDWIEWVETKPDEPQIMRVYLSRIGIDEEATGARRIVVEHRDSLKPEVAEVPPAVEFPVEFSGRQRIPVTAEFQFQGKASSRSLVLVRLVHEGWSR